MAKWTLQIGSVTRTLADWRLINPVLTTVNLGRDMLTAARAGQFDADALCAYGTGVKLYRDGVKWFDGECHVIPRSARGTTERQSYSFAGPWNFLERNVYKAAWFRSSDGSTVFTSHLIFPLDTVANHITRALQYAIDRGANLQIGTITAPIIPPGFEVTDLTIAGAIQRLARYAPDAVGWFDYSTTPPTFNFVPRSSLQAVTLQLPSSAEPFGDRLEIIEPIPRPDIQVDNVSIIYERTSTEDGRQVYDFSVDNHPPSTTGLEDGCLCAVVNLQGYSATTVEGYIVAEAIDTASLDWWKKAVPALNDTRILSLAFADGSSATRIGYEGEPSDNLPRRIVDGQAAPWMTSPDGMDVIWQKEIITREFQITVSVTSDHSSSPKMVTKRAKFSVELTSTNAPAGETIYSTLSTFEDGDPIPTGLAEYLYGSLNPLQYDALIAQHKAECDGEVTLGKVINLTGADSDWASMNALVQRVTCDLDRGVTEITCGPPGHLSLDQILEILRVGRIRRRWTNPSTQDDGIISARNVELGRATANNNAVPALPEFHRFVLAKDSDLIELNVEDSSEKCLIDFGAGKTLTIESASTVWEAVPEPYRPLALREVCVKVNGVARKMVVIGSDPYS